MASDQKKSDHPVISETMCTRHHAREMAPQPRRERYQQKSPRISGGSSSAINPTPNLRLKINRPSYLCQACRATAF